MIQKNKILTAVLMAGILSVVSLSGSGVTRAESVQTGQTEKKSLVLPLLPARPVIRKPWELFLKNGQRQTVTSIAWKSSMQTGMCPNRKSRYKILSKNGQMPLSCVR